MGYKSPTSSLGSTFNDAQSFHPQSVTKPSRGISDLSLPSFFLFNEREHKSSMLHTYLFLTCPPTYALLNQFVSSSILDTTTTAVMHEVNICSTINRFGQKIFTKSLNTLCLENGQTTGRSEWLWPADKSSEHFNRDPPSNEAFTEYLCLDSSQNGDPRGKMNIWQQVRSYTSS